MKLLILFAISVIVFFSIIQFALTQTRYFIQIKGFVLDSDTGERVNGGNVTAIIEENGENVTTIITNGEFNATINSSVSPLLSKMTIGLVVNASNRKSSFEKISLGVEGELPKTQVCFSRLWQVRGLNVYAVSGQLISSGTVTITVDGTEYSNSTSFSTPLWTAYVYPCLKSGKVYTFVISVTDAGSNRGTVRMKQVAWDLK